MPGRRDGAVAWCRRPAVGAVEAPRDPPIAGLRPDVGVFPRSNTLLRAVMHNDLGLFQRSWAWLCTTFDGFAGRRRAQRHDLRPCRYAYLVVLGQILAAS